MLAKLRQKSWYYAVTVTIVGGVISLVVCIMLGLAGKLHDMASIKTDSISYLAGISLMTSVMGVLLIDKLTGSRSRRLKWFINQPFLWQFIAFIAWAILLISVLSFANATLKNDVLKIVESIYNIVFSAFSFYVIYLFLRMIFKKS